MNLSKSQQIDKATMNKPINDHGATKYDRAYMESTPGRIDVYSVLKAFDVRCPARQHAIKKLLCAGIRGKNDELSDLKEANVAVDKAIKFAHHSCMENERGGDASDSR